MNDSFLLTVIAYCKATVVASLQQTQGKFQLKVSLTFCRQETDSCHFLTNSNTVDLKITCKQTRARTKRGHYQHLRLLQAAVLGAAELIGAGFPCLCDLVMSPSGWFGASRVLLGQAMVRQCILLQGNLSQWGHRFGSFSHCHETSCITTGLGLLRPCQICLCLNNKFKNYWKTETHVQMDRLENKLKIQHTAYWIGGYFLVFGLFLFFIYLSPSMQLAKYPFADKQCLH